MPKPIQVLLSAVACPALLVLLPGAGCERAPTTAVASVGGGATDARAARGAGVDPTAAEEQAQPIPSAETRAEPTAPGEGSMFVQLGRVKLPVPAAWRPSESGQAPMHRVHLEPGPGMTCDIGLIDDHGRPEEAEKYLSGADRTYGGETSRADNLSLGGVALQGIRIAKPKAMPRASLVEAYVGIVGAELVALNLAHLGPVSTERKACEDAFTLFAKALQ